MRRLVMRDSLTFEDGVLLCKHIYQSAIEKTLQGVIEQEQIFYRAHEMLNKIEHNFDNERVDELLYLFNMENIYAII
jgi:hypothetical protein